MPVVPGQQVDLSVNLGKVKLANPIMTASGTCGYGDEYSDFVNLKELGAFVTKSVTLEPRAGNEYPRIVETRAGMMNAIGLANVGLDVFLSQKVPIIEKLGVPIFVNVAGRTEEEYIKVARALEQVPVVKGIELNISCPNVKAGGMQFGVDPSQVLQITRALRSVCRKNILIVKLSPNVTDIAATAASAVEGGADALSMVNTFTAMAIDIEQKTPILGNRTGGLSGPAIRPIAVYMVQRVYSQVAKSAGVPIIGMGGIQYARDAIEFLLAGASALAVGTALFVDPRCIISIRDGISEYMARHGIAKVSDLTGSLKS